MLGIYVHIPFCAKKCPYCDFYSESFSKSTADLYTQAVITAINSYTNTVADTLYFGGGTPNLIGSENIKKIISAAKKVFSLENAEITMEANPESLSKQDIFLFKEAGVNRLSLGLQSSNLGELSSLNRRHTPDQVKFCVEKARECGINNISLDLMVGILGQTARSLKESIEFCDSLNVNHISAYLLKIEEGTHYFENQKKLNFPDEDFSAELYEFMATELEKRGFEQYEISNFAKKGFEARHNTKYWLCEEYIGIGAAAHGFFKGQRYYYQRDLRKFIENPLKTIPDGEGGNAEEELMLALRLRQGINLDSFQSKHSIILSSNFHKAFDKFCKMGLAERKGSNICLTKKGFLVSNAIISEFINEM